MRLSELNLQNYVHKSRFSSQNASKECLRAFLTLIGMGVGVAMVVFVHGLGLGALGTTESQIEASGPTLKSQSR